jgi:hypothetical protein
VKIHGEPFVKLYRLGWRRTALCRNRHFRNRRCAGTFFS